MYFVGRVALDLAGTSVQLQPPANFFGGVANLLTQGRWGTREEMETYKLLAFAQSANRGLRELGVQDVIRVSIQDQVIYEDLQSRTDDFAAAMDALKAKLGGGAEPDPTSEFDMVLKYDDGVLTYVIDLDFVREHLPGADPAVIGVTAVPSQLRRNPGESTHDFETRISRHFESPERLADSRAVWANQMRGFLDGLAEHFRSNVNIDGVHTRVRGALPRERSATTLEQLTAFGAALYGFELSTELAYLTVWDSIWAQHDLRLYDFYYGSDLAEEDFIGQEGLTYADARRWRSRGGSSHGSGVGAVWWGGDAAGAPGVGGGAPGTSFAGPGAPETSFARLPGAAETSFGSTEGATETSFAALGEAPQTSLVSGSAGEGGWLSAIGDFFSGDDHGDSHSGGDSGADGGGDGGGGDGGGCGGGGCGGP